MASLTEVDNVFIPAQQYAIDRDSRNYGIYKREVTSRINDCTEISDSDCYILGPAVDRHLNRLWQEASQPTPIPIRELMRQIGIGQ